MARILKGKEVTDAMTTRMKRDVEELKAFGAMMGFYVVVIE